jgi:hypothetical protein
MSSDYVETLGFIASGLVFTTFFMKTMIPLRYMAIQQPVFHRVRRNGRVTSRALPACGPVALSTS